MVMNGFYLNLLIRQDLQDYLDFFYIAGFRTKPEMCNPLRGNREKIQFIL